ncbi:uncharacterized protein F4822DRAFT_422686 [Hypoxylon trugodes]|uniref:uncharacterized protein n=1 Tax=Hypoxylon trugodes TaxID=326681 RepID=UPI00219D29C3|nr:uncharacterized protein F4822DRAFT_422686 [Hypoxylon trugodes]KAI1382812.1 hypothetical protein F4822DRAFT_422686 [Hypoxylon trugodes]
MKVFVILFCLASATLSLAAPTTKANATFANTASVRQQLVDNLFVAPDLIRVHNVKTNLNTDTDSTTTQRAALIETSTLYEVKIPQTAPGANCSLVLFAGAFGDVVSGAQSVNFFNNTISDLAKQGMGNLRDRDLGRVNFNPDTKLFDFDETVVKDPIAKWFECPPAGTTMVFEAVAVGDFDAVNITQAPSSAINPPNGFSLRIY